MVSSISASAARSARTMTHVCLLVATRKGAFFLDSDAARRRWELRGPVFLGQIVNHLVLDPRDRRTLLMAAHGPSGSHALPLDRSRHELKGGLATARLP